ncbi:class I SAM-dependent methyltransferase [Mucilaginibacter terrigena]|uniref:Class I SAM-dependent methyltransferase n=1 Tax=Mucilaginibacter terrigena TaxID=2492395 RepID=A0A4Q5LR73_9SPHI|nr:class I SAM-dependent methyltransferase [Mucilaginibacter terrigena]RYU91927.1 class I SAM-dependent methyltransferase [Mucilaginibacter terrigena]
MKEFWDDRYRHTGYAYGIAPNRFLEEQLPQFKSGSILLPADGEGRNGVFAAHLGWQVTSVDLSAEGRIKALKLAENANVKLAYLVGDIENIPFKPASFDAIALIYAHFAASNKAAIHQKLNWYLKPGGILILEAFRKEHISYNEVNPNVGGPKELGMLYSTEELTVGFPDHDILLLEEKDIVLDEGKYHQGSGAVLRYVGRKKQQ